MDGAQTEVADGKFTFGDAIAAYRKKLARSEVRPKTKEYLKLILRIWPTVENLNVRRITSTMVEDWLVDFKANAAPHVTIEDWVVA